MEAIELASAFSLITNRLRYCGPKDAYKEIKLMHEGKEYSLEKIRQDFRKYEGLYVYLKHLADKLKKDFLDYDIVEAYWLGNNLLEKFDDEDTKEIIKGLVKRGLPEKYSEKLLEKLPEGMNLTHSFNVLFIGVGMTTGSVPTNIITMNKCNIMPATLLKIKKDTVMAAVTPFIIEKGVLKYGEQEIQHFEYDPKYIKPRINEVVAVHWDYACKVLTVREKENLDKYTKKNVDALNAAKFFI